MPNIYKMSNAGGFKTLNRYPDMLAGNATWVDWQPEGAFEPITSITIGATSVSSINFGSIPQNYAHLQVRAISFVATTDQILYMQVNSDDGSNYASHLLSGNGVGSGAAYGLASQNNLRIFGQTYGVGTSAPTATISDLLDYSNTNKYKTIRTFGGTDRNGTGEVQLASGLWMNTAAITSVQIYSTANLTQYSSYALYGIKG
jgi:hypothetical protein